MKANVFLGIGGMVLSGFGRSIAHQIGSSIDRAIALTDQSFKLRTVNCELRLGNRELSKVSSRRPPLHRRRKTPPTAPASPPAAARRTWQQSRRPPSPRASPTPAHAGAGS